MTKETDEMNRLFICLGIILSFFACKSIPQQSIEVMAKKSPETICKELIDLGYSQLFMLATDKYRNQILENEGAQEDLMQIINNTELPLKGRFLACELLFRELGQQNLLDQVPPETLGKIYSSALKGSGGDLSDFGVYGNSWGFMSYLDNQNVDGSGPLGKRLLLIGKPAVPELSKLLNNNSILWYEGSRDATLGNNLKFRVKDAAAYYIFRIQDQKVIYHENISDRDKKIEDLKEQLGNEKE